MKRFIEIHDSVAQFRAFDMELQAISRNIDRLQRYHGNDSSMVLDEREKEQKVHSEMNSIKSKLKGKTSIICCQDDLEFLIELRTMGQWKEDLFIDVRSPQAQLLKRGVLGLRVLKVEYEDFVTPVHVVTSSTELPIHFLMPSEERPIAIGLHVIGLDEMSVLQLAFPHAIYLVDPIVGGEELIMECKDALESPYIVKVIHDCKRCSETLYLNYGIKLNNVIDTQIAYSLIIKQKDGQALLDDISFPELLAEPRFCGILYVENADLAFRQCWMVRPFTEVIIRAAADYVRFLLFIYNRIVEMLNERSLWHLKVRSALRTKSVCLDADWPAVPPVPDSLVADDNVPEAEILSFVDVNIGRVDIAFVKQECPRVSIFSGGNKVFLIGAAEDVQMAEELLS